MQWWQFLLHRILHKSVEAVVNGFADTIQLGGIELWFNNGTEAAYQYQ